MNALQFVAAASVAFVVLAPMAAWGIWYDFDRSRSWPVWLRNLYVGVILAISMSVCTYAAVVPNPDWCAQFEPWGWWWIFYGCWGAL